MTAMSEFYTIAIRIENADPARGHIAKAARARAMRCCAPSHPGPRKSRIDAFSSNCRAAAQRAMIAMLLWRPSPVWLIGERHGA
jgi:hypothetical protein